jgi:hypothetical protein
MKVKVQLQRVHSTSTDQRHYVRVSVTNMHMFGRSRTFRIKRQRRQADWAGRKFDVGGMYKATLGYSDAGYTALKVPTIV